MTLVVPGSHYSTQSHIADSESLHDWSVTAVDGEVIAATGLVAQHDFCTWMWALRPIELRVLGRLWVLG